MANRDDNVVMEGVRIVFRNFAGAEGKYNRAGNRNFGVLLDDDVAAKMEADGWNVKWLKPKDESEDDHHQAWLPVGMSFSPKAKPPRVVMVTSRGRTNIDEDIIDTLDWVDISNVDLIVRPYAWEVDGKTGIKAMLQSIYVTIVEDPLEAKYAEMDQQ